MYTAILPNHNVPRCIESSHSVCAILIDEIEFTGMYNDNFRMYSTDNWCHRNPKNYQVWFHRRWLTEQIHRQNLLNTDERFKRETEKLEKLITSEPKHYNAWSHKLFLSNLFKAHESDIQNELSFTQKFIDEDVRNNSAWSYRRHCCEVSTSADWQGEISFTLECLKKAPSNESAWVYLRSIPEWCTYQEVESFCDGLLKSSTISNPVSPMSYAHVLDTLAAVYERTGRTSTASQIRESLAKNDMNRQAFLRYRNQLVSSIS